MTVVGSRASGQGLPGRQRPDGVSRAQVAGLLDLAAVPTAVSCARAFASSLLRQWGAACLEDEALLVVSELVTNAVKATGVLTPKLDWSDLRRLNVITVRLLGLRDRVVIEVHDVSPKPPVKSMAHDDDDEGGRGLHLVEAVATRWGHFPTRRGKAVWAELLVPAEPRARP